MGLDDRDVTEVELEPDVVPLAVGVDSPRTSLGCPVCGAVAGSHRGREVTPVDAPCPDQPVRLV